MASSSKLESAVLGGGCFWCLDATFRLVRGVEKVVAGYSGGNVAKPDYTQVSAGTTGHAEVVKISYDPKVISYEELLEIFFTIHDPTTLNHQGNDVGEQYRSIILYSGDLQRVKAEKMIREFAPKYWDDPIVTELRELKEFYPAEEYHQNYFAKNPESSYCQLIINPKLDKLQQKFKDKLKP